MNLPLARMYRLAPRGGGGLACDNAGVALGAGAPSSCASAPTRRDDGGARFQPPQGTAADCEG